MFGRNEGLRRFAPYLFLLMAFMSSGCQTGGEVKKITGETGNRITICDFSKEGFLEQLREMGKTMSDVGPIATAPNGICAQVKN